MPEIKITFGKRSMQILKLLNLRGSIFHITGKKLPNWDITPLEVESIMKCFPLGKAVGPDSINNRILQECSRELSHPLCFLINHSLSLRIFPET